MRSGAPARPEGASAIRPWRIYHIDALTRPSLSDWRPVFERIRALGFDLVALSGLFAHSTEGIVSDPHVLAPPLARDGAAPYEALAQLAVLAYQFELGLLFDVRLDRTARGGVLERALPHCVAAAGVPADPREPDFGTPGAALYWRDGACTDALYGWWAELLGDLAQAGAVGFRLEGIKALPAGTLARLVAGVRTRVPGTAFLAWGAGLAPADLKPLAGIGLDAVTSSLPWWNGRDTWLCEEYQRLAALGDVVHPVALPRGDVPALARGGVSAAHAERLVWTAVALGGGWFMPSGFESGGTSEPFALDETIRAANRFLIEEWKEAGAPRELLGLTAPDSSLTALYRPGGQGPASGLVCVLNPNETAAELDVAELTSELPDPSSRLTRAVPALEDALPTAGVMVLPGAGVALLRPEPAPPIRRPGRSPEQARQSLARALAASRLVIDGVGPVVDDGRFAVRRTIGERIDVRARAYGDGHDVLGVALRWRAADANAWHEVRMQPLGNDAYHAQFVVDRIGHYEFFVEAWIDRFGSWTAEAEKKVAAGLDLTLEVEEGCALVRRAAQTAAHPELERIDTRLEQLHHRPWQDRLAVLLDPASRLAMAQAEERAHLTRTERTYPVESERLAARYASWYELFPRSEGAPARHGRLTDVIKRLPAIRAMGFDVLYFPPIHPIGGIHRKGRNNSLAAEPDDPGSPYAIGSSSGGHTSVHPELGTLEDFATLRAAAAAHGLEIALDFAIQCAPDHPWLSQHPEWFSFRPDGTVRYAENPPKKYEDIVNVDFYSDRASRNDPHPAASLWLALRDVVLFWVDHGVRIFRVDNPHTKPLPFWEWLIADVRGRHPDVIFLAEAFTRPAMMTRLGKIGFSESYTYFTWRHTKAEFTAYMTELTQGEMAEYFRPHFFVNTPDINPYFLQSSGRAGFLIRAALATLLSGLWGMYSGFELCEARALPGREEYADSEKYQLVHRDWNVPGNIVEEISRLNAIRHGNPALHTHLGLSFHTAHNDQVLYFSKATRDRSNVILAAICLDPHRPQSADIEVPLWEWGLPDTGVLEVLDLWDEHRFTWHGKWQRVGLDPATRPFYVWRVAPVRGLS